MTQPNSSPNSFTQQNERNASRTRSSRGKSPSCRMSRWPCKDFLKGTCTNSFCKKWPLQNACSTRPRAVANLGKSAHMHIVDEQPSKKSKTNDDKSTVATVKKNDQHHKGQQHKKEHREPRVHQHHSVTPTVHSHQGQIRK